MNLFKELKRRNVFRVAAAYGVVSWLLLQMVDVVAPMLALPGWVSRAILLALLVGFPIAVIIAWAFEVTPEGIKRESEVDRSQSITRRTGQRLNRVIIAGLLLVIVLLVVERTMFATHESASPEEIRPSVAVLPFTNLSTDPEQQYFADGLTEEILNSLAQLPELLVTARTSSFFFKDKEVPIDEVAERLGVAHVLEGSVRRSGDNVRITAQLIRASDGFHLWSQTYDATMDNVFEVQDDIAEKVVTALDILLDDKKRNLMEQAGVRNPEAYALFARGFELYLLAHFELPQIPTLAEARGYFQRATELAPEMWAAYFTSADLQSHILLDQALGEAVTGIDPQLVANAQQEHARLLGLASRSAPNEAARDFVDLSRQLFSNNWSGLGALTRRILKHTQACSYDQWTHLLGAAYGDSIEAYEFYQRGTRCNAVDESQWNHSGYSAIYGGRPELALAAVEEGELRASTSFFIDELRIYALVQMERFEDARVALSRMPEDDAGTVTAAAFIAAAQGDAAELARQRAQLREELGESLRFSLMRLAAWSGDIEAANRIAMEVDSRPAGPTALLMGTFFCFCGAPFDIEATPNFKARFQETGLDWPPLSPIEFPLKSW